MNNEIKIGDRVLVQQCWEDDRGYYHDEQAKVLSIESDEPLARLKFDDPSVDRFYKDEVFPLNQLEKIV